MNKVILQQAPLTFGGYFEILCVNVSGNLEELYKFLDLYV